MGLLQREIEAAGFSTITLSPVPDLTASVCAPRVAAIEYPESPKQVRNHSPEDPPIVRYLERNPCFLPKLLSRNIPG